MKKLIMLICALALFSGCATVKESYGPDGRKAYSLNCSGLARGWDKCYSAAGELCGASGYDVLDRSSEDSAVAGFSGNTNSYGGFGAKSNERSMVVSCKAPKQ